LPGIEIGGCPKPESRKSTRAEEREVPAAAVLSRIRPGDWVVWSFATTNELAKKVIDFLFGAKLQL